MNNLNSLIIEGNAELKVSEKMQKGITVFTKDSYNSILDLLINFGISYENELY